MTIETELGTVAVRMADETSLEASSNRLTINTISFEYRAVFGLSANKLIDPFSTYTLRHDWERNKYRRELSTVSTNKVNNIIKNKLSICLAEPSFVLALKKDYLERRIEQLKILVEEHKTRASQIESEISSLDAKMLELA